MGDSDPNIPPRTGIILLVLTALAGVGMIVLYIMLSQTPDRLQNPRKYQEPQVPPGAIDSLGPPKDWKPATMPE